MLHTPLLAAALALLPVGNDSLPERSTVRWTPEAFDVMSTLYERITAVPGGVEFAACLRAERHDAAWVVTGVVVPPQTGNAQASVEGADCTGFEGAAHSHPLWDGTRDCLPSFGDRATFASSSHDFLVVWCDLEAFTYRTRDLGVGGKDDRTPDRAVRTSAEPHLWRPRAASSPPPRADAKGGE